MSPWCGLFRVPTILELCLSFGASRVPQYLVRLLYGCSYLSIICGGIRLSLLVESHLEMLSLSDVACSFLWRNLNAPRGPQISYTARNLPPGLRLVFWSFGRVRLYRISRMMVVFSVVVCLLVLMMKS